MGKSKNNIERNRLDYLLTDIMPVEVSELFSFGKFYEYLLAKQSILDEIIDEMHRLKARNSEIPFSGQWGNWATTPLKFGILKGTRATRKLNLVQPFAFRYVITGKTRICIINKRISELRIILKNCQKRLIGEFYNKQGYILKFINSILCHLSQIPDCGGNVILSIEILLRLTTNHVSIAFIRTLTNGV